MKREHQITERNPLTLLSGPVFAVKHIRIERASIKICSLSIHKAFEVCLYCSGKLFHLISKVMVEGT